QRHLQIPNKPFLNTTKNSVISSHSVTIPTVIPTHNSVKNSAIEFHVSTVNSRISSQYVNNKIANPTIPAITIPIGDIRNAIAVPTALTTVTIEANPEIILGINPMRSSIGPTTKPNAAASAETIAIVCLVPSLKPLNQSAKLCNHPTSFSTAGIRAVPMEIITSSKAEDKFSSEPWRLSFIVFLISLSATSELSTFFFKYPYRSPSTYNIAVNVFPWFNPANCCV